MIAKTFAIAVALLLPSLVARAQSVALESAASAPATAAADTRLRDLSERLGSEDFATREAAQKDLGKLTWRDLASLKQFAQTVIDPEAKTRLATRIQQLEEAVLIDPPPISVDLNGARLSDVVAALELATGEKFVDAAAPATNANVQFTLSARDKPFWEIFSLLNDQHPLRFQSTANGLRLIAQDPGMHPTIISGGVAAFATSLTRTETVNLEKQPAPAARSSSLQFQAAVFFDPRLKITRYQRPRFIEVHDDAGNDLLTPNVVPLTGWTTAASTRSLNISESLRIPQNPGKKIASAKMVLILEVPLASESVDITEVDKKLNQPQQIAGQSITIRQFALEPGSPMLRFDFTRTIRAGSAVNLPITATIIDAAGRELWSVPVAGGTSGGRSLGSAALPLKLRLSATTTSKQFSIPLEFKDLPLP